MDLSSPDAASIKSACHALQASSDQAAVALMWTSPPRLTDLVLHHTTHRVQQQSISQAAWRDAVQVRLSCEPRAVRARLRTSMLAQRPATAPAKLRTLQTTKWPLFKTTPHSVSVHTKPIPRQALPCDAPAGSLPAERLKAGAELGATHPAILHPERWCARPNSLSSHHNH